MKRTPHQGLWTVVRFNWHFFAIAGAAVVILAAAGFWWLAVPGLLAVVIPLLATSYAYDRSGLYDLRWLDMTGVDTAANIHAGFDETTGLLRDRFPTVSWHVFEFYDPEKHTEISIRRARTVSTPDPATIAISSERIPLPDHALDRALLILAAHEIRDPAERTGFFRELKRVVKPEGGVIVVEHLRDAANLLAYGPGAFHFLTRAAWTATFGESGWEISREFRINKLITCFHLKP